MPEPMPISGEGVALLQKLARDSVEVLMPRCDLDSSELRPSLDLLALNGSPAQSNDRRQTAPLYRGCA